MGRRKQGRSPHREAEEKKGETHNNDDTVGDDEEVGRNDYYDGEQQEEGYDDPYVYSDDSASLSDAYFLPDDGDLLARPFREPDPLHPHQHIYYYGSTSSSTQELRATAPLWGIQEDAAHHDASTPLMLPKNVDDLMPKRERKRQRRQQREANRLKLKQLEQVNRERMVTQVRGKPQQVLYWQDLVWAVLFVLQLLLVIACAIVFGLGLIQYTKEDHFSFSFSNRTQHRGTVELKHNETIGEMVYTDDDSVHNNNRHFKHKTSSSSSSSFTFDYQNVLSLVGITGFYACVLTYIGFGFMLILSRYLIQVVLVFSILLALAWGLIGLSLDPYGVISIMGFAALLLTLGYTMYNWNRIPFAATNLYIALCAMRCTADITLLGLASLVLAFAWCVVWSMAFVGLVNLFNSIDCDNKDACDPHMALRHAPIYLLLLFSFHWTNSVIKNVVRTTVASAIGTWWFSPAEIRPVCTSAVAKPLFRSVTKSLGSICLGSLALTFGEVVSGLVNSLCGGGSDCINNSKHDDKADLDSAADSVEIGRHVCGLGSRITSALRPLNRWAFTYVGMYGYSFVDAGDKAIQLFEIRGWLEVVNDGLIQSVLIMASIVIGGSAGTFAVVVEETDGYYFSSFHMPTFSAFVIGSILGYVFSNILLLGVVGSAVDTILVCFAAGPFEFEKHHPRLSHEMRTVWMEQVFEPQ